MKAPIKIDPILLPKSDIDNSRWAVVACDQFTSNKQYWADLKSFIDDCPSALNLIFPEVYLSDNNGARIKDISQSMKKYIDDGIFTEFNGIIKTRRKTESGVREGLMITVDLDAYSFKAEDKALIRATEGTILSRIPPRVEIREGCSLELPHIMLLIDDKENSVIAKAKTSTVLYDFALNMGGGHLTGEAVSNPNEVLGAFENLLTESGKKYDSPILFAVGDGNHSLATAKACWEKEKSLPSPDLQKRYALCEVVNIYDNALNFEPIHRVVINVDNKKFKSFLTDKLSKFRGKGVIYVSGKKEEINLPMGTIESISVVEDIINDYIQLNGGKVDYIHGMEELKNVSREFSAVAIALPTMKKEELFVYITSVGLLPRKSFSMGEAEQKRYYYEVRKIKTI